MTRDPHHRNNVVERHYLALEVIPQRINDGDMLPGLQPKHTRMLSIIELKSKREHRLAFVPNNLFIQKEPRQRHKNLPPDLLGGQSS